jgi:hypothetical protein
MGMVIMLMILVTMTVTTTTLGMTMHAPVNAKYHRQDSHKKTTSACVPLWASVGVSPFGTNSLHFRHAAFAGLSGGPGQ